MCNSRKSASFRRNISLLGAIGVLLLTPVLVSFSACSRNYQQASFLPVAAAQNPAPANGTRNRLANVPQQSYADLVQQVSPAVVTIRSARRVRAPQQYPFMDDPFFRQFFGGRAPQGRGQNRGGDFQLERALGSGVVVRGDGYILTNHHVVDGASEITVELTDRRTMSAKLVGSDAPSDLAVLRINASNLPTLPLGDSDRARVGDVVLAIGNPLGLGQTVTQGIISAKERTTGLSNGSFEDFLQTDAAINQGNSGGALVNTAGELIGINSQILSPSGGNIGIGFAIPSNMARNVMNQLVASGKVRRGQIGIGIQPITSDLAASMNLPNLNGVLVNSVRPGSPADKAGLKQGDVITAINGTPVSDSNTLRNMVASTPPGGTLNFTVLRNGHQQNISVRTEEYTGKLAGDTTDQSGDSSPTGSARGEKLGLSVEPITPDVVSQLNLKPGTQGVMVTEVDPVGPAAEAGIQTGDVIQEVNRRPVRSAGDIRSAAGSAGSRPVLLLINRDGQSIFVTVRPK
jgi:serine protease Do